MSETVDEETQGDLAGKILATRQMIRRQVVETQAELAAWIDGAKYGGDRVIIAVALLDTAFDICLSLHGDPNEAFDLIRRDFRRAVDRRSEKL